MIQELIEIVVNTSSFSIVIPVLVASIRFRKLTQTQRLLCFLVVSSLLTEVIANILWYQQLRNLEVYNIFALINFNFLAYIFRKNLNSSWKTPLKVFLIIFNGYFILDALFLRDINYWEYNFHTNLTTSASAVLIILTLCYFFKLLKEVKYQKLEKNPLFWISSGVTLYYSGTLILFLLSNVITDAKSLEVTFAAWGLNSFFNLILNTSYTIALWVSPTK